MLETAFFLHLGILVNRIVKIDSAQIIIANWKTDRKLRLPCAHTVSACAIIPLHKMYFLISIRSKY
jgi:hypothetical protein